MKKKIIIPTLFRIKNNRVVLTRWTMKIINRDRK